MNRKNRKIPNTAGPEEHFETLGELLTQLKTHLTTSAGKKGSYGDYLRLLDFYRDTRGAQAREVIVGWVEDEKLVTEPAA
jgi:hypothetical protein